MVKERELMRCRSCGLIACRFFMCALQFRFLLCALQFRFLLKSYSRTLPVSFRSGGGTIRSVAKRGGVSALHTTSLPVLTATHPNG